MKADIDFRTTEDYYVYQCDSVDTWPVLRQIENRWHVTTGEQVKWFDWAGRTEEGRFFLLQQEMFHVYDKLSPVDLLILIVEIQL